MSTKTTLIATPMFPVAMRHIMTHQVTLKVVMHIVAAIIGMLRGVSLDSYISNGYSDFPMI